MVPDGRERWMLAKGRTVDEPTAAARKRRMGTVPSKSKAEETHNIEVHTGAVTQCF